MSKLIVRTTGVVVVALIAQSGCGGASRCPEVKNVRDALVARVGDATRAPDMRLTLPFDRTNAVIADLLAQEPVNMSIDPPDLGPIEIPKLMLANVRSAVMQPGAAGKVRFVVTIDVGDREHAVVGMEAVIEVEPKLVRKPEGTELTIGFGPHSVVAAKPTLAVDAKDKLQGAVNRWVPSKIRDKVPRILMDSAAHKLATHLTGAAWETLRQTLLKKLGDVTQTRIRLPDVPIARTELRSTDRALIVDIMTDLPVRRGLAPGGESDAEFGLRMSGSTVTELANWALDKGHAPQWYDRNMKPDASGVFRPRFDYLAEDRAHPFKVYSFQERRGCSYFRVGVSAKIAVEGTNLKTTMTDQQLEKKVANPLVEILAWTKYFLIGGIDRSRKVAAHTQLAVGNRTMRTQVTKAAIVEDEMRFSLAIDAR